MDAHLRLRFGLATLFVVLGIAGPLIWLTFPSRPTMGPPLRDRQVKEIGLEVVSPIPAVPAVVVQPESPAPADDDFQADYLINRPIDTIVDPLVGSVKLAADRLLDDEMVLGLIVEGQARAYPMMEMHGPSSEVVNDTLGGRPILVAWCSLCQGAVVFSREVQGHVLRFGVAGLWKRTQLFTDSDSGSLWSQILGECMRGKWKGETLTQLPTLFTDWKTWRTEHPETTVMLRPRTTDNARGSDTILPAETHVVGIRLGGELRAWALDQLEAQPFIQDRVGEVPILITFDAGTSTVSVLDRRVPDRTLSFERDGERLIDVETRSVWDPIEGRALSGPLSGTVLPRVPSLIVRSDRWDDHHPDSIQRPAPAVPLGTWPGLESTSDPNG